MSAHPGPRDPAAHTASAVAFALALAAGLVVAMFSLAEVEEREWAGIAGMDALARGESASRISRLLNERFLLRKPFHAFERGSEWLFTRDWGTRVREGCTGWLFLVDELETTSQRDRNAGARAARAGRVARELEAKGIRLLVAVVPDKSRIEGRHLCGLGRPPHAEHRIASWVASARAAGADAIDLTAAISALPGERYFRTDTHWNENGARGAAQAITAALRARGLAEEPKARPPAIEVKQLPRPGDLVRVAGLEGLPAFLRPEPEITVVSRVPPLPSASDDLFGSAGLPAIALVGTSFSRSANFAPFLERQLGAQVANAAKEGGDFDGALDAYLASAAFRETPPRVVIWEIPERVLEK